MRGLPGFFLKMAIALAVFACSSRVLFAAEFGVTPFIIDKKASARDILKETIGVMNSSQRTVVIYTFVNNTDPVEGKEAFVSPGAADLSDSLANWIEISRGRLELLPGEKREIPLLIQVNLRAKPGMYHAVVTFAEGEARAVAEGNQQNGISVSINVEVLDDAKEVLELGSFLSSGTFIAGKEAKFRYEIRNIGNGSLAPRGELRIYNRSGEEVATLPVNSDREKIDPNSSDQIASVWKSGSRFGKYKAMLNVEYGDKSRGTLQDTIYFWLIPWKELLTMFFALGIVFLSLVMYWHNNYSLKKKREAAYSIPREFRPNAPALQNTVAPSFRKTYSFVPSPRIVASKPIEIEPEYEDFPEEEDLTSHISVAEHTLSIPPKRDPAEHLKNSREFTVNLKG